MTKVKQCKSAAINWCVAFGLKKWHPNEIMGRWGACHSKFIGLISNFYQKGCENTVCNNIAGVVQVQLNLDVCLQYQHMTSTIKKSSKNNATTTQNTAVKQKYDKIEI